jgi:hypothetical protein
MIMDKFVRRQTAFDGTILYICTACRVQNYAILSGQEFNGMSTAPYQVEGADLRGDWQVEVVPEEPALRRIGYRQAGHAG